MPENKAPELTTKSNDQNQMNRLEHISNIVTYASLRLFDYSPPAVSINNKRIWNANKIQRRPVVCLLTRLLVLVNSFTRDTNNTYTK